MPRLQAQSPAPPVEVANSDIEVTATQVGNWSQDWCQQAINSRIDRRTKLYNQILQRERLKAGQATDQIYVQVKQFNEVRRVPMTREELQQKIMVNQRPEAEKTVRLSSKAQHLIKTGRYTAEQLVDHLLQKRTADLMRRYEQQHRSNLSYLDQDIVQAVKDYELLDRQIVILGDRMDQLAGEQPPDVQQQLVCPRCGPGTVIVFGICAKCNQPVQ